MLGRGGASWECSRLWFVETVEVWRSRQLLLLGVGICVAVSVVVQSALTRKELVDAVSVARYGFGVFRILLLCGSWDAAAVVNLYET